MEYHYQITGTYSNGMEFCHYVDDVIDLSTVLDKLTSDNFIEYQYTVKGSIPLKIDDKGLKNIIITTLDNNGNEV